jgi:hypothetical protein
LEVQATDSRHFLIFPRCKGGRGEFDEMGYRLAKIAENERSGTLE